MWNALWIFMGGGLGSLARWGASGLLANRFGETFPWGTLVVNVSGSFVIGIFATITGPDGRWLAPATFRQIFMLGICGGYATFYFLNLNTLSLGHVFHSCHGASDSVVSNVFCPAGVWLRPLSC